MRLVNWINHEAMGIFDFLKRKTRELPETKDGRKAECPYCHKILEKIPAKKTTCPYCGEVMFVRTRPQGNIRVVVTKAEAEQIEEDWAVVSGTHDTYIAEKAAFEKEREILKKRFGKEPAENDIRWGLLNKSLLEHARHENWGFYRNARFGMAEILRREIKLNQALKTYLEVCYIDLNGPNNRGGIMDSGDREILIEFPAFDPTQAAFLAPGVIDLIRRVNKKLMLTKDDLKKEFIQTNARPWQSLKLPLSPEQCWSKLEVEL